MPPLVEVEPGHRVACFNPVPEDAWLRREVVRGMTQPLVELDDLRVWFPIKSGVVLDRHVGDVKAVDGVSLAIERGETLGLVGESGCGKSTLGRAILRLYEPTGGRIVFDGKDITHLEQEELRPLRRRMQMVFQDPFASLNPRHSVGRIVGEPLRAHGARVARRGDEARARAARDRRPAAGRGERGTRTSSRAASGSGSASRARSRSIPDFIVADEPVSALDVSIQAQILNLLESLQDDFELTYLFIAHDLAVVRHISDRIAVMYLGSVVEVVVRGRALRRARSTRTRSRSSLRCRFPTRSSSASARRSCCRRPAEPGEPAGRLPVPHALPVRAAEALPRRGAAAPAARRAARRVPLGGGDQNRRASSARAGAGVRARPARAGAVPPPT